MHRNNCINSCRFKSKELWTIYVAVVMIRRLLLQSKTMISVVIVTTKNVRRKAFSEATQCDMCYSWVHATCEGLKKEQYK